MPGPPPSIREAAIKNGLGRPNFRADPRILRRGLLRNGYIELPVTGAHAVEIDLLPPLHKNPFDRMLVAQCRIEGLKLLTADKLIARYPGPIQAVRIDRKASDLCSAWKRFDSNCA